MPGTERIDWSDMESAAVQVAGNWQHFQSFAWSRGVGLEDAEKWGVSYTGGRDCRLLEQSNETVFNDRLRPFSEGEDPDVIFERHSHWAVGYLDGFSIRIFRPDGSITPAFEAFCRIKEALDDYPILDESDYSRREYEATLANCRSEMWQFKELPVGWEAEVYGWFGDSGQDRYTENRDDEGGWAGRDKITEALQALGYLPTVVAVK